MWSVRFAKYYRGDKFKVTETGGECSTHESYVTCKPFLQVYLKVTTWKIYTKMEELY
jgi:hypothetical protein